MQALIIALTIAAAYSVFFRSKTRPKVFTILASLLAVTSLCLLSVTIAFTVIFATKSARVSASLGGVQLPQSIISAQARALGVSPLYKKQSFRESQSMSGGPMCSHDPLFLSPSCCHPPLVHLVVHNLRNDRRLLRITCPSDVANR